jgi:hypothetical protein
MKRPPALVRECVVALSRNGRAADLDLRGTHYRLSWVANGKQHLLIISRSPGDRRAPANTRALLKRLQREEEART